MIAMFKTVAESVALGTALIVASLDFSGAQAQTINVIRPGAMPAVVYPSGAGRGEAVAQRQRDGHFHFEAKVNGATVPVLFDTGATYVSLSAEDAEKAGFDVGRLNFSNRANTANGVSEVAPVTIATLSVGGITQHDVPARVSRPGAMNGTLLGQSFMARLATFSVDGQTLTLRGQ